MTAQGSAAGTSVDSARGEPRQGARSRAPAPWVVRTLPWLALGTVVLGGLVAAVLLHGHETSEHRDHQVAVAEQAAAGLRSSVAQGLDSLRGASALLVGDGTVSEAEFRSFGADVLRTGFLDAIGYSVPVTRGARTTWERRNRLEITERRGDALVRAGDRPRYIVSVFTITPPGARRSGVGFDLFSDPGRRAALRSTTVTGDPAFGDPIVTVSSGKLAYFAALALNDDQGVAVGYISATVSLDSLLDRALAQLPPGTRLSLRDGDRLLVDRAPGGAQAETDVFGRRWVLHARQGGGPDHLGSLVLAVGTILAAAALATAFARQSGHQRALAVLTARIEEDGLRAQRLAELGRVATSAVGLDDVARELAEHARSVTGSDFSNVALLSFVPDGGGGPDTAVLHVVHDSALAAFLGARRVTVAVDDPWPQCECVRENRAMVVEGSTALKERYPALVARASAAGIETLVVVPVRGALDTVIGAIGFGWTRPVPVDAAVLAALTTIADLSARTLERSSVTDVQRRRAAGLAGLAQALSTSPSSADVAAQVAAHLPACYDAAGAVVMLVRAGSALEPLHPLLTGRELRPADFSLTAGTHTPAVDCVLTGRPVLFGDHPALVTAYPQYERLVESSGVRALAALPLRDAGKRIVGTLSLAWRHPVTFDEALTAELATAAELVAQTLERVRLAEIEHDLVASLQRRFLHPLPVVPGIEVEARYEPASRLISIGGDFYDLRVREASAVLVVGDVAGHGPSAVTDMARLHTLVSGLAQGGTPLGALLDRACRMQDPRERIFATVAVVEIDPARQTIASVLGGHPPPVLRAVDGTVSILEEGRTAPLGADPRVVTPSVRPFPPGSLLVLYTDGLVERRREPLETGIRRLAAAVASLDPSEPLDVLLDRLLDATRSPDGPDGADGGGPIDDDVVVVLVRASG